MVNRVGGGGGTQWDGKYRRAINQQSSRHHSFDSEKGKGTSPPSQCALPLCQRC